MSPAPDIQFSQSKTRRRQYSNINFVDVKICFMGLVNYFQVNINFS